MKILVYRYGSICEPDVIDGLKKLGHTVSEVKLEMTNKNPTVNQVMEALNAYLFKEAYNFVFTINFFPVISEICNSYKLPYACWTVDCPILELYSDSIKNKYNRIFLFDHAQFLEFHGKNPNNIFYLPLATNVERFEKVCSTITKEDKKFMSDVAFVGSLYSEKCPYNQIEKLPFYEEGYLNGIMEAQLKIYGYNFLEEVLNEDLVKMFKKHANYNYFYKEQSDTDMPVMAHQYLGMKVTEIERFRTFQAISSKFNVDIYTGSDTSKLPNVNNRGFANSQTEMPKIFHLSKININTTAKPIRTGIPLRLWDIMGCGGFVLTNYQTEIPEYFEIGKDLDMYGSEEELLHKIEYYLTHEQERKQIAKNGYEKVRKEHTYVKRLEVMLNNI